jgi:uncharacterized coiled-coil protein SlyX
MQMNPVSKSSFPTVLDPVVAAVMGQLEEQVEAQDRVIAEKNRALAAAEAIIQQLKEALRLERIRKYGKQSEKLSDLQLQLLDFEPAVSSDEIETEVASGPLPEAAPRRTNKPHPGRNELPAHLERIEEIVACAAEQCTCGKCGRETQVIGYEETEVLGSERLTGALLDRLTHHVNIVEMNGDSYRLKQSRRKRTPSADR